MVVSQWRIDRNCQCDKPSIVMCRHSSTEGQIPGCLKCRRLVGHPIHICLNCSGKIWPGEAEEEISNRRRVYGTGIYSKTLPLVRYRHADHGLCRAELAGRRILPVWPRKTGPHRADAQRRLRGG